MKYLKPIILASLLFLYSCGPEANNTHLNYKNIIILSDLSSRLNNLKQKDTKEIHNLINYFIKDCVKPGEKIGDNSCIYFSTFSEKKIACIDLQSMTNINIKQQYINSTNIFKNKGLARDIKDFEYKVRKTYSDKKNTGLDLISSLIEKITSEPIIKKNTYFIDGIDTTFINFDNRVYVFTDGYLEYLNKESNTQFYFGSQEIETLRQYCKINNVNIEKALKQNKELGLPEYKNPINNLVNLYIQETHERDKDTKLQTYLHPTGQRDNEILEAVWRKWAIESGFKSFHWKKY